MSLNETHDPGLRSWVESANRPGTDFPIQNLPYTVFRRRGGRVFHVGVGIGDAIADPAHPALARLLEPDIARACESAALNDLMDLGAQAWASLRLALSRALRQGSAVQGHLSGALVPQAQAEYALPARIGNFTDFYASIHHATAVGKLLRPEQPLLPNYKWMPIAYHGRASSVCVSGTPIRRPCGQLRRQDTAEPVLGPTARLDYEVELGVLIGAGNSPGQPIPIERAWDAVFGVVLLNDWSARDIQAWEYQPLGPFLSKSFATTVSPWVVTREALQPFRVAPTRPLGDPEPLRYLRSERDQAEGALDVMLQATLATGSMRAQHKTPVRLSETSSRHAYWTIAQMIAHHTVNGCNLVAGDLLGTGTQSGPTASEAGSLIELTSGGREPLHLPDGAHRAFLEDGDEVGLYGYCERAGTTRIGFGSAFGTIVPAGGCGQE